MVPENRKLIAAGAVALALSGCAPAGYDAADYGGAAAPAADTVVATPSPVAGSASAEAPQLSAEEATTELTGTRVKRMGEVIENEDGFVLYRFDDDTNDPAKSNCAGDCARVWPPALTTDGKPRLRGVDPALVGTVTRGDGTKQLTVKGWPLYSYVGDPKPGTWKGQNVAGKWFVIKPDGTKNLTCLPPVSKPVAPPAADATDETAGSDYSY